MRAPTAAALLTLLLAIPAISQTTTTIEIDKIPIKMGAMADTENSVRWKYLATHKMINSKQKLRETARENLVKSKKLPYELQRVEVAGMLAVDEVNEAHSEMFSTRLKLSNLNEVRESRGFIRDAWNSIFNRGKDLREALSDTRGNPTQRSEKIIAELSDKRINELFAHSWGTEAVYLGLLSGKIIPPKKLFIVGVPESNEAKWLMLAKYTGIEVHVVGFEWDKAKVAGNLALQLKSGLPDDAASLEELWSSRCAVRDWKGCADSANFVRTKFDYNVGVRSPDAPKDEFFRMHLSKLDHDRMLYYRYLYNRNLFNKTVDQLEIPQLKLIKAEENRILDDAMGEARSLIMRAREQAHIQNRDHDERLKNTYADLARRSCANPGSVTQAELDSLPKPYGTDVMDTTPRGLGECAGLAYAYLRVGTTAEDLRRNATPLVPIDVRPIPPPPQPAPVRASRPPVAIGAIPPPPFSTALPRIREFAIAACRAPDQVPLKDPFLYKPYDRSSVQNDDDLARGLAMGLDDCSRQLFNKLISTIRAGEYLRIDRQWIRSMVAAYTPVYVPPPSRGPRCEDFGVSRCPCEDGTPGCEGGKPY